MRHHLILRVIVKLLVATIILFALYVLFHGEYSPGGGFQAGVIFASAFTLYGVVIGVDVVERIVPPKVLIVLACVGVLIYSGVGILTLLLGGNFLEYAAISENVKTAQQIGIMLVEVGVGITVGAVMIIIFVAFARRERQ